MQTRHYIAAALVIFIFIWTIVLVYIGADSIVAHLGAQNGYIIMFLVALFGGISSIGGVTYTATLITLAAGGLNPLFLALASGLGVSIGDTVYFYIGRHGFRTWITKEMQAKVDRLSHWLDQRSPLVTYIGIYIYTGFTPLPNDILTLAVGLTKRKYIPSIIALTLGNMTLTFLTATLGAKLPFL